MVGEQQGYLMETSMDWRYLIRAFHMCMQDVFLPPDGSVMEANTRRMINDWIND